jgi:hypothetical protein
MYEPITVVCMGILCGLSLTTACFLPCSPRHLFQRSLVILLTDTVSPTSHLIPVGRRALAVGVVTSPASPGHCCRNFDCLNSYQKQRSSGILSHSHRTKIVIQDWGRLSLYECMHHGMTWICFLCRPFLSQLLESDQVVTSSDYYGK